MAPSNGDWRKSAACLPEAGKTTAYDMVPDPGDTAGEQLAKKICQPCPVRGDCLAAALQHAEAGEATLGVWGGLTGQERDTMIGLGLQPRPCPRCGLDCVPIKLGLTRCSSCKPRVGRRYNDYRPQIEQLIAANLSRDQIAEKLRLPKSGVVSACKRWKLAVTQPSSSGHRDLMPCGTPAAKARHHRKEKYSWRRCERCRNVPWPRGKSTPKK